MTIRGIAAELGRAPSTVSREIARSGDPDGRYRPHHAEHAARLRACKPRERRIVVDHVLAETVRELVPPLSIRSATASGDTQEV